MCIKCDQRISPRQPVEATLENRLRDAAYRIVAPPISYDPPATV